MVSTQERYERGELLLKAGQWLEAAEALAVVVQQWPQHGCAHHLLGKAQAQLGEADLALALQRRSCALDPALGWNWFALAELLQERGAWDEAQQAFGRAAEALPQQRWIADRARRLKRRLEWQVLRELAVAPRFSLEALAQLVWQLRPDLRQRFAGDREEIWIWLLLEGPEEYLGAVVLRDALIERLRADGMLSAATLKPLGLPAGLEPPISQLLHAIWFQQPRLQRRFDLDTLAGRVGLFWWFVLEAVELYQLRPLLREEELDFLHEPPAGRPDGVPSGGAEVPRLALAARRLSAREVPDQQLSRWFFGTAVRQFQLGDLLCERRLARLGVEGGGSSSGMRQLAVAPSRLAVAPGRPFGVNVIGYAEGQLGIGEDLRMAVQALDAAGVPCSVYNVSPDRAIDCADRTVSGRISDQLPYRFNLFCLTGIETARVGLTDTLPLMLPGSVNIGAWPWEFGRWPLHWAAAYSMVDEIWASSEFAVQAYRADAAVPVMWMPMVVDVEPSSGFSRVDFQLPEAAYLFVFAFDCSSSLQRKNPWAVLDAFQDAFPQASGLEVGLVVKVMRGQMRHPAYRRLRQRANADPRIHLIEQTLPRPALLDLYRACDAFVSLHRCEGFGRAIAEAMLLGKAVVSTAYSGNLDFCTQATAQLVPASLKPVLPGEYPEAQGLAWAQPDVGDAALAMRRCQTGSWRPSAEAVQAMAERYGPASVGAAVRQRLEQLWAERERAA